MSDVQLYHGDCLELMPTLPAQSVQMVFADLPYGITRCAWDSVIPFASLWPCLSYVKQKKTPLIFTAKQPFTSALVTSNVSNFKYGWVWEKTKASGFLSARRRPLVAHEDILIFGRSPSYYPQGLKPVSVKNDRKNKAGAGNYNRVTSASYVQKTGNFPRSIVRFQHETRPIHPTQKPVALLEWLIKTYTNPGDTILDPVAGSGTTAIAAMRTGRKAICIEKDATYFAAMTKRVEDERARMVQAPLAI